LRLHECLALRREPASYQVGDLMLCTFEYILPSVHPEDGSTGQGTNKPVEINSFVSAP
jgi:hypothetical protein